MSRNASEIRLIKRLRAEGCEGFIVGASGCAPFGNEYGANGFRDHIEYIIRTFNVIHADQLLVIQPFEKEWNLMVPGLNVVTPQFNQMA